jgi:hypothetical protein
MNGGHETVSPAAAAILPRVVTNARSAGVSQRGRRVCLSAGAWHPPCARGVAFGFGINFACGVAYGIAWSVATCRRFGGRTLVSVGRSLFG